MDVDIANENKQVRSEEIAILAYFIIFMCSYSLVGVILSFLSYYSHSLKENKKTIDTIKYILLDITLFILYSKLFKKFTVVMKNNLNYYFLNNWKNILFIFQIASAFSIVFIITNLTILTFKIDEEEMIRNESSYNIYIRLIYLFLFYILNTLRFLYC